MNNRKTAYRKTVKKDIFLGTSLMLEGILKVEQDNKASKALSNYMNSKTKTKKQMVEARLGLLNLQEVREKEMKLHYNIMKEMYLIIMMRLIKLGIRFLKRQLRNMERINLMEEIVFLF